MKALLPGPPGWLTAQQILRGGIQAARRGGGTDICRTARGRWLQPRLPWLAAAFSLCCARTHSRSLTCEGGVRRAFVGPPQQVVARPSKLSHWAPGGISTALSRSSRCGIGVRGLSASTCRRLQLSPAREGCGGAGPARRSVAARVGSPNRLAAARPQLAVGRALALEGGQPSLLQAFPGRPRRCKRLRGPLLAAAGRATPGCSLRLLAATAPTNRRSLAGFLQPRPLPLPGSLPAGARPP